MYTEVTFIFTSEGRGSWRKDYFKYSQHRVKAVQTVSSNGNYYAMSGLILSTKRVSGIFYNHLHTNTFSEFTVMTVFRYFCFFRRCFYSLS